MIKLMNLKLVRPVILDLKLNYYIVAPVTGAVLYIQFSGPVEDCGLKVRPYIRGGSGEPQTLTKPGARVLLIALLVLVPPQCQGT